ncbi:hypothetical protein ACFU53_02375 [Streptomyces sp. NPDC057474]|uniref:hypothetical protein n=1 Tax=Streptomyces sp. NPDC057474 TaxID=3346144 RepID=UPI003688298E
MVAATADGSSALGGPLILEEHGWRHNPGLDIYTLPITTHRSEALDKVGTLGGVLACRVEEQVGSRTRGHGESLVLDTPCGVGGRALGHQVERKTGHSQ